MSLNIEEILCVSCLCQTFCKALILLRNKDLIDPSGLLELFFELLRCHDKLLRKVGALNPLLSTAACSHWVLFNCCYKSILKYFNRVCIVKVFLCFITDLSHFKFKRMIVWERLL